MGVLTDVMEAAMLLPQSERAASFSLRGYRTLGMHSLGGSQAAVVSLPLEPLHRDF